MLKSVFENGVIGKGKNMIFKHDLLLNAHHNLIKLFFQFLPDVIIYPLINGKNVMYLLLRYDDRLEYDLFSDYWMIGG